MAYTWVIGDGDVHGGLGDVNGGVGDVGDDASDYSNYDKNEVMKQKWLKGEVYNSSSPLLSSSSGEKHRHRQNITSHHSLSLL